MAGADHYRILRRTGVGGQVWVVDEREQAGPSFKTPFYGWPEGDDADRHWLQRAIGAEGWEAERNHLRAAYQTGQLPGVRASPFIHAPVDLIDGFDVYLVSELAETDLQRVLLSGPLDADACAVLEQRMRGALDALHAIDLMHCDVREDNVLRVNGEWKLGDLGGVIAVDNPVVANQIDPAYRPSGVKLGDPAAPTHDLDALAVVLEHAAHGLPLSDEAGTV